MKIAARRRLAVGVLGTSTALVAGLLVLPAALAADEGLDITPSAVFNTSTAATLTFESTDADFITGGSATFSRIGADATFTVDDISGGLDSPSPDREGTAEVDFTDVGDGLYSDGPADAGTYAVTVTGAASPVPGTGGGTDNCASCFTVLAQSDVDVTSVAPSSLRPGTQGNVSLLGKGFEAGTRIAVLLDGGGVDSDISPNNEPTEDDTDAGTRVDDGITTSTELQRRFVVAADATPGARDVRVTNRDGRSDICQDCFFVAGPALTSTNPAGGSNEPGQDPTSVTFTGSNVTDGEPRLEFLGDPGPVPRSELAIPGESSVRDPGGTAITADYDLSNAAPGAYQPVVQGADGVVNACDCRFTVLQADSRQPALTSLDRSTLAGVQKQLQQGTEVDFLATGSNFSKGATLTFDPPAGLTVTDVQFLSPEELVVTIAAASDAAVGDRDVEVVLTDGKTSEPCAACLTVTAASGASPSPTASGQPGNEDFSFTRLAGDDRYATAARIATSSYTTAETVLLANGESDDPSTAANESHFPDALAAAYYAGFRSAPTLLTKVNAVPVPTQEALSTLAAKNVVIIGGTAAVSAKVESDLKADGYTVTRLGGDNRYETAKTVAETPPTTYVGENPDGDVTAIVASGERFPDALVAGPLGYARKLPVLITAGASLSAPTKAALENLGIEHVLIPGGDAVVSPQTQKQIEDMGITVQRFAGQNRSETATLVAAYAYDSLGFDKTHVDLARGKEYPDALAGGPHAGVQLSPILLTATTDDIGPATEAFLRNRGSQLTEGDILGGLSAVSQEAEDQAEAAIREGDASPSPSASPSASGSASPSASATASP